MSYPGANPKVAQQLISDLSGLPSGNFSTIKDDPNTYLVTASIIPIVILGVGTLSLLIYQTVLCCRMYGSCKCRPESTKEPDLCCVLWSPAFLAICFTFCLVGVLICSAFIIYGDTFITLGYFLMEDGLTRLAVISTDIYVSGTTLLSETRSLASLFQSGVCNQLPSDLRNSLSSGALSVTTEISKVWTRDLGQAAEFFVDASETVSDNVYVKDVIIYVSFAILVAAVLILGIAACCMSKGFLAFAIIWTELVIFLITVLACAEMIAVAIISGFCLDVDANLLYLAPQSTIDTVDHYLNCSEASEFDRLANSTSVVLGQIGSTLDASSSLGGAASEACTTSVSRSLSQVAAQGSSISANVQCQPINAEVRKAANLGLCTNLITGLVIVWAMHFLAALGLYLALMVGASLFRLMEGTGVKIVDQTSTMDGTGLELGPPAISRRTAGVESEEMKVVDMPVSQTGTRPTVTVNTNSVPITLVSEQPQRMIEAPSAPPEPLV